MDPRDPPVDARPDGGADRVAAAPDESARADAPTPAPGDEPSRHASARVKRLVRLARGLAHELKNPLSTMAINLALLEEDWNRSAAARNPDAPELSPREHRSLRRIRTLQREVARLEDILKEFVAYVKGQEINRSPHDVTAIVRDLLEFVEPEDGAQGIRHHVDLQIGLPLAMLDESAFKRAVLNLLVNARQAMPEGGELLVRLRRAGTFAELMITDTGVGMGPEELERCFDEYWSTKKGGTGLGLPTAKRIVEEHGGRIQVLSEVGRGTAFTVLLPLAVELTHGAGEDGQRIDPEDAA